MSNSITISSHEINPKVFIIDAAGFNDHFAAKYFVDYYFLVQKLISRLENDIQPTISTLVEVGDKWGLRFNLDGTTTVDNRELSISDLILGRREAEQLVKDFFALLNTLRAK